MKKSDLLKVMAAGVFFLFAGVWWFVTREPANESFEVVPTAAEPDPDEERDNTPQQEKGDKRTAPPPARINEPIG